MNGTNELIIIFSVAYILAELIFIEQYVKETKEKVKNKTMTEEQAELEYFVIFGPGSLAFAPFLMIITLPVTMLIAAATNEVLRCVNTMH